GGQLAELEPRLGEFRRIDFAFPIKEGFAGAETALIRIQAEAKSAASRNANLIVLRDRSVDAQRSALPALLALAAVWKSMLQAGAWQIPLVIETGQVIDTHHIALLVAAGASAVFPYLALELAVTLRSYGEIRYRAPVRKGLRQVILK